MPPAMPPGCLFAGMLKKKSPKALLGARWQKRYGIGDKMKTSNSCVRATRPPPLRPCPRLPEGGRPGQMHYEGEMNTFTVPTC